MFETSIKRVAIYCRVSTDEQVQHGNGLEVQKEALLKFVEIHKDTYSLDTKHIFVDEGKSWANKEQKDRPELYKMFHSAQNWEFDVLLVWKIDRFFRKTLYLLEGVETLSKLWVWFISITQPFDTTHAFWKMTLQMLWVIGELERDLIKERTQSWVIATMKKGKWWRWCVPYGYKKNEDWFLEINKEEAEIVKFVYHLLVEEGQSLNSIIGIMNSRNIETPSFKGKIGKKRFDQLKHKNHWYRSAIHTIVTNKTYTGTLIQNQWTQTRKERKKVLKPESEWIITDCPQIIDEATFDLAQTQLQKNSSYIKRPSRKENDYMLSTLLQDKETWYKYTGYTSSKNTKNYRLNTRNKTKEYISPKWISANRIEPVVWDKVVWVLQDPKLIIAELEKLEAHNNSRDIEWEILLLEKNKEKTKEHSKQLLLILKDPSGMPIDDIKSMIQENQNSIDTHDNEIAELKKLRLSEEEKQKQLKSLEELSMKILPILRGKLSYKGKMEVCRLLIERIQIDWDKLEIQLIVPDNEKNKKSLKANKTTSRLNLVKDFFEECCIKKGVKRKFLCYFFSRMYHSSLIFYHITNIFTIKKEEIYIFWKYSINRDSLSLG